MSASIDFNSTNWTDAQKIIASMKASAVENTKPYLNPKLTLWFPPADSTPFTTLSPDGLSGVTGFPAYPAAGSSTVILQKIVEQGKVCVIRKMAIFNQGANPPDGSGNVIWSVLVNGAGVKGMNQMYGQFGAQLSPQDCQIIAFENDVIQVVVQVPTGKIPPPGTTGARFDGYTYPLSEAILSNS